MDRYVIERDLPGAGALDEDQLREISASSNEVLSGMEGIEWLESYVTDDKLYCVYEADDAAKIEQHAAQGGFPCNRVEAVRRTISPQTGR